MYLVYWAPGFEDQSLEATAFSAHFPVCRAPASSGCAGHARTIAASSGARHGDAAACPIYGSGGRPGRFAPMDDGGCRRNHCVRCIGAGRSSGEELECRGGGALRQEPEPCSRPGGAGTGRATAGGVHHVAAAGGRRHQVAHGRRGRRRGAPDFRGAAGVCALIGCARRRLEAGPLCGAGTAACARTPRIRLRPVAAHAAPEAYPVFARLSGGHGRTRVGAGAPSGRGRSCPVRRRRIRFGRRADVVRSQDTGVGAAAGLSRASPEVPYWHGRSPVSLVVERGRRSAARTGGVWRVSGFARQGCGESGGGKR